MNPARTNRSKTKLLTDLPNVGTSIAGDLQLIGIRQPDDLKGQDPLKLYELLSQKTGQRQDPCVLDVFMSIVEFMNGKKARPWWEYTATRKKLLTKLATTTDAPQKTRNAQG